MLLTMVKQQYSLQAGARLLVVLCAIAVWTALAVEGADIPGVTRPTSMPTPTVAIRDATLPSVIGQCNSDHPDSCAARDILAIQREDNQPHFEKRQEPGEGGTSSRVVNVPQNAPNGGLSMTQPPITAQATVRWPAIPNCTPAYT